MNQNIAIILSLALIAGCGPGLPGAYGVDAAQAANQKASTAVMAIQVGRFSGTSTKGSTDCTEAQSGLAWCEASQVVVFCGTDKTWHALACSTVKSGSSCNVTADKTVVCE